MSVQIDSPCMPSENGSVLWRSNKENSKFNQCECCPYGYHIDLDFVRFCEVVSRRNDASASKERRKERRRQRQSMEVLLGLTSPSLWNVEQQLPQIPQEVVSDSSPELVAPDAGAVTTSLFVQDDLHRAVQDFEDTLERTHKTPPNHLLLDSAPDVFFDRQHGGGSGDTSLSTLSSPITPQDAGHSGQHNMSTSAAHEALLQEFDVANSGLSHGALQNIRHQMAVSLERMRELEEQVKLIPILQVQLSVAKEQKRKLNLRGIGDTTLKKERAEEQERSKGMRSPSPSPSHHLLVHHLEKLNGEDHVTRKLNAAPGNGSTMGQYHMNSTSKVPMRDIGLTCKVMKRDIDTMHRPITRNATTSTDDLVKQSLSLNSMTSNSTPIRDIATSHDLEKLYTESEVKKMVKESVNIYKEEFERKRKPARGGVEVGTQSDGRTTALHIVEKRDFGGQVTSTAWCQEVAVQASVEAKRLSDQGVQVRPRAVGVGVDATVKTRTFGTQRRFVCVKCDVEKRSVGFGSSDVNEYDKVDVVATPTEAVLLTSAVCKADVRSVKCNTVQLMCEDRFTDTNELRVVRNDVSTLTMKLKCVDVCVGTSSEEKYVCSECEKRPIQVSVEPNKLTAEDNGKLGTPDQESKIPRRTGAGPVENPNRPFKRQTTYTKLSTPKVIDLKDITANSTTTMTSALDRIKPLPSPLQSNHSDAAESTSTRLSESSESSSYDRSPLKSTCTNESPSPSSTLRSSTPKKSNTVELGESSTSSKYEIIDDSPRNQVASNTSYHTHHASGPSSSPRKNSIEYYESRGKLDSAEEVQGLVAKVHLLEEEEVRTKVKPSKKMQAAMKVVNDSLKKSLAGSASVGKAASDIIQREWFQISSTPSANPHVVEDYLDAIEEFSSSLLEHVVNITDKAGNTAMHYALSQGNFDVVSILLDSKVCNINRPNAAGYTAVMLVSLAQVRSQTHRRVLQRFLADADVNIRAKQHGQTALMLAVSHNRLDMVQLLIEGGADLNIQDEDGSTALMCAAEHGHAAIVQFLINQPDADQNIKDVDGSTALDIALEAGHKDVGILLYAHKHFSRNNSPHSSLRSRRSKSTTPTARSSSTPPRTPSSPLPRTSQE